MSNFSADTGLWCDEFELGSLSELVSSTLGEAVANTDDKVIAPSNQRKPASDLEERKVRALEQIANALTKIQHELIQLRVQAAKSDGSSVRRR